MSTQSTLELMQAKAAAADPLGYTVKFDLKEGGVIFLDGKGDKNVVTQSDAPADTTVIVSQKNLDAMLNGSLSPTMAFMGQKLKVEGNMGVAMKLGSIFS